MERNIIRPLVATVLFMAVLGLTQCRRVSGVDPLLSGSNANVRPECVQACNEHFRACVDAEQARHEAGLRACGADASCRSAEDALHQQNQQGCVRAMQECKSNCYNEGGGGGGR